MLPVLVITQEWDAEQCGRGWNGEADGCCARRVLIRCDQPRCSADSMYSLILPALESIPLLDRDVPCSSTMIQPARRVCPSHQAATRRRSHTGRMGSRAVGLGVGIGEQWPGDRGMASSARWCALEWCVLSCVPYEEGSGLTRSSKPATLIH